MSVTNIEELIQKLEEIRSAQKEFSTYSQEQVDRIFRETAIIVANKRASLVKMAVEDKVTKNHFHSDYVYNKYKDEKAYGVIEGDETLGINNDVQAIGVIATSIPMTNPTLTAVVKILIALKTRNGIILSPHPRAKSCTIAAIKIVLDAAVKVGAPKGIVGWIDEPSIELTQTLMREADITLDIGKPKVAKSAYLSVKSSLGVGIRSTPVIIDETAHIKTAVNSILLSKDFDSGVACDLNQSIIVVDSVYSKVRKVFKERGAYILNEDEVYKIRKVISINGSINRKIIGKTAYEIAEIAGIKVPETTMVLIDEVESVGQEAFEQEKLSPVLAIYRAKNFDDAVEKAKIFLELDEFGDTSVLYVDSIKGKDKITKFGGTMKTVRTFVNMPASQGTNRLDYLCL